MAWKITWGDRLEIWGAASEKADRESGNTYQRYLYERDSLHELRTLYVWRNHGATCKPLKQQQHDSLALTAV
jgi:hypothetical protein